MDCHVIFTQFFISFFGLVVGTESSFLNYNVCWEFSLFWFGLRFGRTFGEVKFFIIIILLFFLFESDDLFSLEFKRFNREAGFLFFISKYFGWRWGKLIPDKFFVNFSFVFKDPISGDRTGWTDGCFRCVGMRRNILNFVGRGCKINFGADFLARPINSQQRR